jgi:hypothetical protein
MSCVGVSGTKKMAKRKSGSGVEEVYTSTWPYFSALKFIVPSVTEGINFKSGKLNEQNEVLKEVCINYKRTDI